MTKVLIKNPQERITAEAALKHPWLVQEKAEGANDKQIIDVGVNLTSFA